MEYLDHQRSVRLHVMLTEIKCQLHQVRAAVAGQQLAVQAEDDAHETVVLIEHLQNLQRIGPQIDPDLLRAPADDHSLVTAATAASDVMNFDAFAAAPHADYVSGVKEAWRRQILFVKDADPLGPNYAVLCDTLSQPDNSAIWRLWTTSAKLDLHECRVSVTGVEDVDMDVYFALPAKPALKQEAKARTASAALRSDGAQVTFPYTQNGIIVPLAGQPVVTALLLPRLKTEQPLNVTALSEGRVMRVQTAKGDDWIFLSATPFTFKQDDLEFAGTVGVAQIRGGKASLTLPAPGRLKAKGQSLEKSRPN